jgi:hypothetical protein
MVDVFLKTIATVEWMNFGSAAVDIATRRITGPGNHEYSVGARAAALCVDLGLNPSPGADMLDLLAKWRNKLVHSGDEERALKPISPELFPSYLASLAQLTRNAAARRLSIEPPI